MNTWQIVAWVAVLAISITGLLTRDWRWFGASFFVSLLLIILLLVRH